MLACPLPYIANTAGWITAEVGRQPWLIYGLMRTAPAFRRTFQRATRWFTLIGFMGMYMRAGNSVFCFWCIAKSSTDPNRRTAGLGGSESMGTLWFCLVAVMIAVYVVLDGFDLGAGIIHLGVARNGRGAPRSARIHRPGVGRQRSLAAGRRRHALFRLSGAVRLELQRILSAADDGAVAADPARHLDRVSQPHR